jgi:hypothetical protein
LAAKPEKMYNVLKPASESMKLDTGKIRGDISLSGTRSKRIYPSCSQMRRNEASCGGEMRGNILLLEARSEGIEVLREALEIKGNIYLLKPDQRVYSYVRDRSDGVNPLTGFIQKKIDLSAARSEEMYTV